MAREIKFRAWDKLDGMIYFGLHDLRDSNPDHGVYDVPIMQFAGLEDMNGTEIYDGDIAQGEHALYTIHWDDDMARYSAKIERTNSVLTKNCRFPLWQYVEDDGKCRFKVIGNIYQTPELLNG